MQLGDFMTAKEAAELQAYIRRSSGAEREPIPEGRQ
jgi:hypothetical protein